MDEKLIKEYKAMLPVTDTLESIVAKGKIEDALINAKLELSGIKKEEFMKWKENPNIYKSKSYTDYEQLMAVGYHPQLRELMGVVYIKRPYGYGGSCPNGIGSSEYVRFYVNWTDDGDFTDSWECQQNLGIVHVFDPGTQNVNKLPIEYAVRTGLIIPKEVLVRLESICAVRRVRAILSWVIPPPAGNPNWQPFWGNVVDTNIRFHK